MGGRHEAFQTTRWTEIGAEAAGMSGRRKVLASLVRRYWKPVYCFLRQRGCDNEKAKDLTQGFFVEVVLQGKLVRHADRAKGRFRTFLLAALENYVVDMHRGEHARKRMPSGGLASLDASDPVILPSEIQDRSPSDAFQYAWARELVNEALVELETEYRQCGREAHWLAFFARVIRPILDDQPSPPLPELCEHFGIENEVKASNMITVAKRRFRSILTNLARKSVESGEDVEEEITELMRILTEGSKESKKG
jgi:RNA polymerase sigma-70 factor (ECF subfamily)